MGVLLRLCALACALVCFAPPAWAQPRPANRPRAAAPEAPAAPLFQAEFFGDARWGEAVREEVRAAEAPPDPQRPPTRETRSDPPPATSFQRGTINQEVLQQIIMDRTRRVAMSAVADAISEIAGPAGDRQYLRQLLSDVAALLTDRTGMQNTLIEQLVATLARAVIADAVVRLRLPGNDVVDPCAWRRAVYGEEAGLDREACANFPLKALEGRVSLDACGLGDSLSLVRVTDPTLVRLPPEALAPAPPRPVGCSFLQGEGAPRPWLPLRTGSGDATRLRAYLVDLAFWSLGRTEIFNRQAPIPTCAFPESSPLRQLCQIVEGPSPPTPAAQPAGEGAAEPSAEEQAVARQRLDDARAARAAWVSGTTDLVGAIQVAHDIMSLLRPPLNSRLRALINTVLSTRDLGTFGRGALSLAGWDELASLADWTRAWRALGAVQSALPAFRAEAHRPRPPARPGARPAAPARPGQRANAAPAAPPGAAAPPPRSPAHEALRQALVAFQQSLGRATLSADGTMPNAALAAFLTRPDPNSFASRTASACQPLSVSTWAGTMLVGGLDRAAAAEPGTERDDILCVPPVIERLFPANAAAVADLETSFEALARAGDDARRTIDALGAAMPALAMASFASSGGLDIASISLDRVTELVANLQRVRASLEVVEREWQRPAVQALWQRQPGARPLAATFQSTRRALTGVARMLRIAGALDIEALRDRGVGNVGSSFNALRSLGGPVISRLGPILAIIPLDRPITVETMLVMLEHITPEDIVVSLGVAPARGRWCDEDERSLACWLQRITAVLREVTDVQDARVTIDSDRLVRTLGALGDDFRRRREWRAYFHLTIGLGEMLTVTPRTGGGFDTAFVPLMAEQIGIGVASPSFFRDRLGFRAGVFGSGLLYRLVLDSRESEAFYFGAFAALDLYELLEVFVAPVALVYPPGTPGDSVGFGVVAGASVPLADYLSRL
jgi:hypothetical protein